MMEGAVCLAKVEYYPDVHDKQRYDLGVLLSHCRAQPCLLMESQVRYTQWRTQKIFMGWVLVQGHMVVICIWCALFVTSQFDVISMFPNQRFGEVC